MKRKKFVIGLCVGLCLVLGACKMGTEENHEDAYGDPAGSVHLTTMESAVIASQEDVKREAADEAINTNKIQVSMEEAVAIGEKEAQKYYDNLQLTEVHSYDNDAEPKMADGEDGKREWWVVNFANEEQNYVSIIICDGAVDVVEHFDRNWNNGLLDQADIKLTAKEAAELAKKLGMRGGNPENPEDWAYGYHFKMSYEALAETPEDMSIPWSEAYERETKEGGTWESETGDGESKGRIVYTSLDRIYVKDQNMHTICYEQVPDSGYNKLVSLLFDEDGIPMLLAKDEEGYYMRRVLCMVWRWEVSLR